MGRGLPRLIKRQRTDGQHDGDVISPGSDIHGRLDPFPSDAESCSSSGTNAATHRQLHRQAGGSSGHGSGRTASCSDAQGQASTAASSLTTAGEGGQSAGKLGMRAYYFSGGASSTASSSMEDEGLRNDDTAPNGTTYLHSSGRLTLEQEAQSGIRRTTIDREFEEYFAALLRLD